MSEWNAARVKQLRHDLGITGKELAERIGIDARSVRRWEAPEGTSNHRFPRGAAITVLEQLESEAARRPEHRKGERNR